MSPQRHPDEAVLTDYASGALRSAFAVAVAAHLELCAQCRRQVMAMEHLGGELLAQAEPTAMAPNSIDEVLARLDDHSCPGEAGPIVDRLDLGRRTWLGPGIWIRKAACSGRDTLYLLRMGPGARPLAHGHNGVEFTTVVKGEFEDEHGRFGAGDFARVDQDVRHQPYMDVKGECVCVVASEAPMDVPGPAGFFLRRFVGI